MTGARKPAATLVVRVIVVLLGLLLCANGIFMLDDPMEWYLSVPGVTTTGQFNSHFIRDIGIIYVFLGVAFGGGLLSLHARFGLWAGATAWMVAHALFHLWEVAAGICGPPALARDFPAISLPALIGIALSAWAWCHRPRSSPACNDWNGQNSLH